MSEVRIQLFGGLQVHAGSYAPVTISARKAQALLAFLARHPDRPQPRAKLAALLWENGEEAQQRGSLRQTLAVLRTAMDAAGDCPIAASADAITLATDNVHIDALEFERLVRRDDPEAMEAAAAFYCGEFLEAFNPKAPAFEDWLLTERQHLRECAIQAMSGLLDHYTASDMVERAIAVALRLLALDPLQESVHRSLMSLYVGRGRHASALRQFHLCRDLLRRELDVDPEPETGRLFETIRTRRRRPVEPASVGTVSTETPGPPEMDTTLEVLPSAQPDERQSVSELRHITAFCAEIADPADDIGGQDPERMQRLSERLVETVRTVAETHGGLMEVYVGGSTVAFFGAVVAHGNDAERAARAALQLREATEATLQGEPGNPLRIGIADGTVLVTGYGDGDAPKITGDVVNRAARLVAGADAGEILISDTVHHTLWRLIERGEERRLAFPGHAGMHRVWRLSSLRERPSTMTKLVGRKTERQQFAGVLETCRERGHGLTFHLRGEAGVGKTHLVRAFCELARERGFACHVGAALDFGAGGSRDAVGTVARGLLDPAGDADHRSAIQTVFTEGSLPSRLEPHLHDLLRLPLPVELRSIYDAMDNAARERGRREALAELLRHASAERSSLLVLEDMHWADPVTQAQAATLAATVGDCPAVLVMTARPDGDPVNTAWRSMTENRSLITMDLGPLHRQDALDLAAQHADVNDPFTMRCIERCGGNPLFLEQLLRTGRGTDEGLPGSVQSLVLARMDKMDKPDRQALQAASVLGQRFSLAALRHLIDDPDYDCGRLIEQGFVRPDGGDHLFGHALVQEGAYSSLPGSERRDFHRDAAVWFADRDPILRAEHLDRARDPAAPQAYLEAAREQADAYHYDQAVGLVERGLALGSETSDRFALSCYRGQLLHDLGDVAEARGAYEEALALAQDDAGRCRALLGLAAVKRITDDLDGALVDVEAAEGMAERLELAGEAAQAHVLHGNLLFPRGDLEGCLREHQKSLESAQKAGSAEFEAAALGGLGDVEYMRGRMLSARARYRRCVELARQHGFGRIEVANRPMAAITLWYGGDVAGELREGLAAVEAAANVSHPRAEMVAHMTAYAGHTRLLDLESAFEHAELALHLARQINAPRFEAEALVFRGDAHRIAGRQSEALADIDAGLALSRQTGMAYMGPWYLGILAVATKDAATRKAALAEGEALLADNFIGHNHLNFRVHAIDACLASRDWDEAIRHAAALEAFARDEPLPWSEFFAARGKALAAHGQGRRDRKLVSTLERLKNEGERFGYRVAIPAIETALAGE